MLNRTHPSVYNKSPQKEIPWKTQGYALFARLKNHTVVFTKARKGKMDMRKDAKFVDLRKAENITKITLKNVLLNMKGGLIAILERFLKIKELITIEIKKKSWIRSENQEKKMDMRLQKLIVNETGKRLNVIILSGLLSNLAFCSNLITVKDVKTIAFLMVITMTIQSLWMSYGFVENVMEKNTGQFYQRERLNLWTPKGDAIVQTTEETCRGELEAVPPPRNWSVSSLWLKVIEWLRHTAGCSFYQGQCITNDLWIQNLRSTGI